MHRQLGSKGGHLPSMDAIAAYLYSRAAERHKHRVGDLIEGTCTRLDYTVFIKLVNGINQTWDEFKSTFQSHMSTIEPQVAAIKLRVLANVSGYIVDRSVLKYLLDYAVTHKLNIWYPSGCFEWWSDGHLDLYFQYFNTHATVEQRKDVTRVHLQRLCQCSNMSTCSSRMIYDLIRVAWKLGITEMHGIYNSSNILRQFIRERSYEDFVKFKSCLGCDVLSNLSDEQVTDLITASLKVADTRFYDNVVAGASNRALYHVGVGFDSNPRCLIKFLRRLKMEPTNHLERQDRKLATKNYWEILWWLSRFDNLATNSTDNAHRKKLLFQMMMIDEFFLDPTTMTSKLYARFANFVREYREIRKALPDVLVQIVLSYLA